MQVVRHHLRRGPHGVPDRGPVRIFIKILVFDGEIVHFGHVFTFRSQIFDVFLNFQTKGSNPT